MKNLLKFILIAIIAVTLVTISYRLLFIRIVSYEIAGVKIPSTYNVLTNKVAPIKNYRGKPDLPAMQPSIKGNVGLSTEKAETAKLRWAIFEEWVNQMPQYKGWQTDTEIFKKAMAEFRKSMEE